jgi:hypothetical protein
MSEKLRRVGRNRGCCPRASGSNSQAGRSRGDRVVEVQGSKRRRDTEEADAIKENLIETLGMKRGMDARIIGALIAQHLAR